MLFKRKIYSKLLAWKEESHGTKAIMVEGARRIGKSTIVKEFAKNEYESFICIDFAKKDENIGECYVIHPRNLVVKDGVICIPPYMTMCL